VKQFGRHLLELINATSRNPAMLEEPASIQTIEERVLEWIGNLIPVAEQKRSLKLYSRRQRELNRVLEFMRDAGDTVTTLSQLVEVTDCSAHTLEYAFRDKCGLTPIGFLRLRRFLAARRALIAADMHETTVEQTARRFGFNHMGRFAVEYRKLFGESPSGTLCRYFRETESMQSPLLGR
jgi:AraC family transcriptional regulator, ethanolamine operon transcriptional activator